jgi:competence protein ComEA
MKLSSGVLLVAAVVISFVVAVVTFVAVDRLMPPNITVGPAESRDITVVVAGGVATPGVVNVPSSARLQTVIDAAGGLSADADVASLNMAGRVGDGERIVIPTRNTDDSVSDSAAESEPTGVSIEASLPLSGEPLNVNTASIAELEALPGIGPVLAERITTYRTEHGPFTSVDQLMDVEGISTATLEELLPFITVDE